MHQTSSIRNPNGFASNLYGLWCSATFHSVLNRLKCTRWTIPFANGFDCTIREGISVWAMLPSMWLFDPNFCQRQYNQHRKLWFMWLSELHCPNGNGPINFLFRFYCLFVRIVKHTEITFNYYLFICSGKSRTSDFWFGFKTSHNNEFFKRTFNLDEFFCL